jgi:hypothetical protein
MTVMGFSLLLLRQQQSVLVQIYVFPAHPPIPTFSVPQYTAPLLPLKLAVLPAPPIGASVLVQQVFVAVVAAEVVVLVR